MTTPSPPSLGPSAAVPLSTQVGGHPGVMTIEGGSLLIKPALPLEVAFYQTVLQDPALAALRPYVRKFLGTLKLAGVVDESASAADGTIKINQAGVQDDKDTCSTSFLRERGD